MNLALLYLLILKATVTSFNGPSSLPVLRHELVVERQVITDRQLNAAVTAGRSSPGPMGIYVVSVGYFVAGVPGACIGLLAVMTPSLLILPLIRFAGHRAEGMRVRRTLNAVVLAGAGLVIASAEPLSRDALRTPFAVVTALVSLVMVIRTRIDTIWIIAGAAASGLVAAMLGRF